MFPQQVNYYTFQRAFHCKAFFLYSLLADLNLFLRLVILYK